MAVNKKGLCQLMMNFTPMPYCVWKWPVVVPHKQRSRPDSERMVVHRRARRPYRRGLQRCDSCGKYPYRGRGGRKRGTVPRASFLSVQYTGSYPLGRVRLGDSRRCRTRGRTPAADFARTARRAGEVRHCGRFRRDTGISAALHRTCRNRSNTARRWLTIRRRIFAEISTR